MTLNKDYKSSYGWWLLFSVTSSHIKFDSFPHKPFKYLFPFHRKILIFSIYVKTWTLYPYASVPQIRFKREAFRPSEKVSVPFPTAFGRTKPVNISFFFISRDMAIRHARFGCKLNRFGAICTHFRRTRGNLFRKPPGGEGRPYEGVGENSRGEQFT